MPLIGRQNLGAGVGFVQTPGLAVADVLVELQGLVLGENTYGVDTGIDAVGQRKVDDAVLAAEGDGRLGGFLRQNLQTAALATGQQHGDYTFFLKIHGHSSLYDLMNAAGGRVFKTRHAHFFAPITYHTFCDSQMDNLSKIFPRLSVSCTISAHLHGGALGMFAISSRFSNHNISNHRPSLKPCRGNSARIR